MTECYCESCYGFVCPNCSQVSPVASKKKRVTVVRAGTDSRLLSVEERLHCHIAWLVESGHALQADDMRAVEKLLDSVVFEEVTES